MQGVERHDAPKPVLAQPVHRPVVFQDADRLQQAVERSFLAEEFLDANRSHERRQDHRCQQQGGQPLLAHEFEAVRQPGQRQRQHERSQSAAHRQQERVAQSLHVAGIVEHFFDVDKRNPVGVAHERAAQSLYHRVQEEDREERGGQHVDENG